MAVLVGGQSWGLLGSKNPSKSVALVKLTDASLRALEEYVANKVSTNPYLNLCSGYQIWGLKYVSGNDEGPPLGAAAGSWPR